jgi:hypothetical protein
MRRLPSGGASSRLRSPTRSVVRWPKKWLACIGRPCGMRSRISAAPRKQNAAEAARTTSAPGIAQFRDELDAKQNAVAPHPMRVLRLCAGVGMHDLGLGTASMLARSATSSGKHSRQRSWSRSWKRGCLDAAPVWSDLATFDARPWRGSWMQSLRDCPASPTASPASARERRSPLMGDGRRTHRPLPPHRRRVSPAVVFLENVPAWVTGGWFRPVGEELCRLGYELEARSSSLRRTLAHRISASASGSWPTSRAEDSESCGNHGAASDALNKVAENWPTITVMSDGNATANRGVALRRLVENWASPTSSDQNGVGLHGDGAPDLRTMVSSWATPMASDDGLKVTENSHQSGPDRPSLGLFAPGPRAPEWQRIIATSPWLAPAIESGVHGVADGVALVVDESRRHQLRALGNGGVPLCSAVAWGTLARRLL